MDLKNVSQVSNFVVFRNLADGTSFSVNPQVNFTPDYCIVRQISLYMDNAGPMMYTIKSNMTGYNNFAFAIDGQPSLPNTLISLTNKPLNLQLIDFSLCIPTGIDADLEPAPSNPGELFMSLDFIKLSQH